MPATRRSVLIGPVGHVPERPRIAFLKFAAIAKEQFHANALPRGLPRLRGRADHRPGLQVRQEFGRVHAVDLVVIFVPPCDWTRGRQNRLGDGQRLAAGSGHLAGGVGGCNRGFLGTAEVRCGHGQAFRCQPPIRCKRPFLRKVRSLGMPDPGALPAGYAASLRRPARDHSIDDSAK